MGYRVYFKLNDTGSLACSPIYETQAEAEAEAERLVPLFKAGRWDVLLPILSRECRMAIMKDLVDTAADTASLAIRKVESPGELN